VYPFNFPQYFETSQLGKYERNFVNKENLQKINKGQNNLANWSATGGVYLEFSELFTTKSKGIFFPYRTSNGK